MLPSGARPLDEHRRQRVVQEDPLHARIVVRDERLHEEPFALDVEAKEAFVGRVPREAVRAEVDEARARDPRAPLRADVEEEVGVAAVPV
jgi:hypothetical protein